MRTTETGRRVWERHTYQKQLRLVLEGGQEIAGDSENVSLSGAFLRVERLPATIVPGHKGVLHVATAEGYDETFPCEVRRVTRDGLALHITERAAQFALLLTQDIFKGWAEKGRKP